MHAYRAIEKITKTAIAAQFQIHCAALARTVDRILAFAATAVNGPVFMIFIADKACITPALDFFYNICHTTVRHAQLAIVSMT